MEMDERKIKILQAIINDYINTAEPVGSRTIAKKYNLGISSATIRNEMADLEDMGYLEQLHTSSGRKPSDKGYRLYVDRLMPSGDLTKEEELLIKCQIIDAAMYEVDKILKQAAGVLSELTKLACIIKTPSVRKSYIKSVQLLNLETNTILLVVVTDSGIIKNSIIRLKGVAPSEDVLVKISIAVNSRVRNLTIEEINLHVINDIKKDLGNYEDIFNAIIPVLYDSLKESEESNIYTEGSTNIFNYPEFNDIDKAREFLSLLNDKDTLSSMLNNENNLSIKIGGENFLPEAKGCSIITATYSIDDRPLGTIGLIGPTRIPYSKIVSIMAKVMKELNESLRQL